MNTHTSLDISLSEHTHTHTHTHTTCAVFQTSHISSFNVFSSGKP